MRLRDWPIARRLTGAMILLTVATAVTVQVRGLYRGRAEFAKSSHKTLDVAARKTAMQLDLLLRKARVDLRTLAVNRAIIDLCTGADSPRAKDLLDSYVDNDSDLAMLLVAGTDGSVLTSARDVAKKDANVRTRPYFAPALGGKTYVSGLLWGPSGSGVYLAHPVQRGDSVLGVIVLKLDGDRIVNLIRDMKPLKDGPVSVLYEKLEGDLFVVIASGDPKVEYTTGRPMTEAQAAIAQQRWNRPIRVLPVTSLVDREIGGSATQDGVEWVFGVARPKEAPWIVLTRLSREQFESDFYNLARKQLLVLLVALAFAGLLAYGQARMILRPVRTLTETAERIAGGDLEARAEITTEDELGRLARVFDQMVPQLAESLKLQESLAVAGAVQRDLLPKTPPDFPGLDVFGANEPYEQIGGDYFDFLDLRPWGDQRMAAVVGDVVGHGIGAALLMATARAHVRSRAQPLPELGALFNEINLRLSADLGEEQFMTLALYAFDAKNGRLDWTSAGQDAAFHYRKQTGEIEEITLKNVPLGVLPDWEYKAGSREDLARGDVLLIGTDGIWETRNKEREEFGKERVRNLLQMNRERSAQELVETIFGAVTRFRGELPLQDDVTLVAIRIV